MDNISRLPGCAGQAADAVSAAVRVTPSYRVYKNEKRLLETSWVKGWWVLDTRVRADMKNRSAAPKSSHDTASSAESFGSGRVAPRQCH